MLFFAFLFDNLAQCGNLIYQAFILYGFIFVFYVTVKISTAENAIFFPVGFSLPLPSE